jgi:serine/threonine-protein kinase
MTEQDSIENWKLAKQLFEKYIDLPYEESINEINQDKAIASEVKQILLKLMKSLPNQQTSLETADLSFIQAIAEDQQDHSGKTLDSYKLISKIGHGGMSQVYKAQRIDTEIQKYVALKLLSTKKNELTNTHELLFEQEQTALSKLDHPNIISFHHGGISADGHLYLVMDYEEAVPIDQFCKESQLSIRQIVLLVKQVANALSYSHNKLVIHRDVKPSNILVNQHGHPKVVDFGIASFVQNKTNKSDDLKIYTPDYASPEQLTGTDISIKTDVFSLSAVLFQLITCVKPLPKSSYNRHDLLNHIKNILKQNTIDNDLKNIIYKGMSYDSANRYSNMDELESDLTNWLDIKPIRATKQNNFYKLSKFIKRRTALSLAILFAIITVIVGLTLTVEQKHKAEFEAKKAKEVTRFLIDSLQKNDPDISKGKEMSVRELLLNAKNKIQESSLSDRELTASLEQTIGTALAKIGQYKSAEELLNNAIKTNPNNFEARIQLAAVYLEQKQYEATFEQINFLSPFIAKLSSQDSISYSQIHSQYLAEIGKFDQAIEMIQDLTSKLNPNEIKSLIENKLILAQIYDISGKQNEQIAILEQALEISNLELGELTSTSTNIGFYLAEAYTNMDPIDWGKIESLFKSTLEKQTIIYGKNHPLVGKSLLKYGFLMKSNGDLEKAKTIAIQAKKIALINFDENHIFTAHVDVLLSQLNSITGQIEEAISQLESAVLVYENHFGINHFETNQIKTNLIAYYLKQNQNEKALSLLRPLYNSQIQQLGIENRGTLYVQLNLIKALNQLGKYSEAIAEGETALALSKEHLGSEYPITIGIQFGLSESYFHHQNYQKAIDLAKPLLDIELVINNPGYDKKISMHVIKAYLINQQKEIAKILIKNLIGKYYVDKELFDDYYRELISLK